MSEEATTTDTTNSTPAAETAATTSTDPNSSTTQTSSEADGDKADTSTILTSTDGDEGNDGTDADDTSSEGEGGEAGDKSKDDKAGDDSNALLGAPEGDYEIDASALPEGIEIDKAVVEMTSGLAKEIGLSNEGFTKLAGVFAEKVLPHVTQQFVAQMQNDVVEQRRAWDTATREEIAAGAQDEASPYYGLDFKGATRLAAKAIDRFGGTEFREFLETTGLGNDPRMVRFAVGAGKAIAEDTTFDRGGGAAPKPKTLSDALYGGS
jgi:hypothetical protein